jgi:CRP-like cAMP-binding protein
MKHRDQHVEKLSQVPLFSNCSRDELRRLANRMTPVTIKQGRALVQEGGVARQFFVIEDGQAEVERKGRVVAKLGPGDYVGELALLNPARRNATVTAVTPVAAYALTPTEFETVLREAPRMTRKLLAGLARRLQELDGTP